MLCIYTLFSIIKPGNRVNNKNKPEEENKKKNETIRKYVLSEYINVIIKRIKIIRRNNFFKERYLIHVIP